jgi:uncharacterized membrane protein YcaP (DUF421 family)
MFGSSVPWWEFVVRALFVYVLLLLLIRITGKRQVSQLATFDLVLLLTLSNSVQNAMNAGDNSVTGGAILASTLVGFHFLMGYLAFRHKDFATILEGRPQVLVHNGVVFDDVMQREHVTHHDLFAALRVAGCASVEEVHYAMIENNGLITVTRRR